MAAVLLVRRGVTLAIGVALAAVAVGLLSGSYVALVHPPTESPTTPNGAPRRRVDWPVVIGLGLGGFVALLLAWRFLRAALR